MTEKEIQFRKKREIGDIFLDSFTFIKQEYKPVLKLVTFYVLPFIILYAIVQVYLQKNVISKIDFTDKETLLANIGPIYLNIFMFALFGLFVQSLLVATFYTYIDAYIKKGKGNFSLYEITPHLFSNGLLAIGASILIFIIVVLGFVLCIIPGIYFANTLSLTLIILLFEKKGIGNALLRSAFLVRYQWWNTLLINVVGIIVIWTVGVIFSIPTMIAGISESLFSPQESPLDYPLWIWVLNGISTVVSSVLWVIPYTFIAMQYFNLEENTIPIDTTRNF